MTGIEELLRRDIAAVTGGIVVTDSDLREAREAVDERLYGTRARLRRGGIAAVAAAVVLVAAGTAGFLALRDDDHVSQPANPPDETDIDADYLTGKQPTTQLLEGVWRLDNGKTLLKFGADGSVRFDDQGTLFSRPATTGTYVIDGDRITVTTTQGAQQSCAGTRYEMRASLASIGLLHFVNRAPATPCSPLPPAARGALEQVLPPSPTISDMHFMPDDPWQPLSDPTLLPGVWTGEGDAHVLELDAGGAYYVASGSGDLVDRGTWTLRGSTLTLTSGAGSRQCIAGDKLVLANVHYARLETDAFSGELQQNTCRSGWTPPGWFLLPNANS
jgi:hypothetical protein